MDFLELCLKRESCRNYTAGEVPREILDKILEAGRLAPSACNSQPWQFYVVTKGESLAKIKVAVQGLASNKFSEKATAFIAIVGSKPNYSERVGQTIFGRDFSNMDIGIAVENMSLCAASLGFGTCIIGAFSEEKVKEAIGVSKADKNKVKLVLAVGVAEKCEPRKKVRKEYTDIVKFVD